MDEMTRRRYLPDWMQYQTTDLPDYSGAQPPDSNAVSDLPPSYTAGAGDPRDYPNPADYTGYTGTPADLSSPSTIAAPPPPSYAPAAATSTAMLSPEERAKAELAPYASVDKYGDLRYPHRTKLQVIGDIGKGALLGGIPGAIAGGVGLYRQQALNQRVAEATQSEAAKDQYHAQQAEALRKQQDSEQKRLLEEATAGQRQAQGETARIRAQAYTEAVRGGLKMKQQAADFRAHLHEYGDIKVRNTAIQAQVKDLNHQIGVILSYGQPNDPDVQNRVQSLRDEIDALTAKSYEPLQPQTTAPTTPATPTSPPAGQGTAAQTTDLPPTKKPLPNLQTQTEKKLVTAPLVKTDKGYAHRTGADTVAPVTNEKGNVAQPYVAPRKGGAAAGEKVKEKDVKVTAGGRKKIGQGTYTKEGKRTSWAPYKPGTNVVDESQRERY